MDQIQPKIYQPNKPSQKPELLRVKAFQLLDLFPDELIVHEDKILVVKKEFLLAGAETMLIKDIGEVVLSEAGPFATIVFKEKSSDRKLQIKALPADKAKEAKEIIDRLILKQE